MRRRQSRPVSPWAPRYPSLTEKVKNSFHVFPDCRGRFSCRFADGKAANGVGQRVKRDNQRTRGSGGGFTAAIFRGFSRVPAFFSNREGYLTLSQVSALSPVQEHHASHLG